MVPPADIVESSCLLQADNRHAPTTRPIPSILILPMMPSGCGALNLFFSIAPCIHAEAFGGYKKNGATVGELLFRRRDGQIAGFPERIDDRVNE